MEKKESSAETEGAGGCGKVGRYKRSAGSHAVNLMESRLSSHAAQTVWGPDTSRLCGGGRDLRQWKPSPRLRSNWTIEGALNHYSCTGRTHACVIEENNQSAHARTIRSQFNSRRTKPDRYSAPLNLLPEFTRKQSPNFVEINERRHARDTSHWCSQQSLQWPARAKTLSFDLLKITDPQSRHRQGGLAESLFGATVMYDSTTTS